MNESHAFSLGKAGKIQLKQLAASGETDDLEFARQAVAADILRCLEPFRFLPIDIGSSTSTSDGTILMLFGWLDEELRREPKNMIENTGIPTYLAPEIAIHLLVDAAAEMKGVRQLSLGERRQVINRVTILAAKYAYVEQAQILRGASAAAVEVEIRHGQQIALSVKPIKTKYGMYDHLLFYSHWIQYPFDDDDIVPEYLKYLTTRTLPPRCDEVSKEMRELFGYGLEDLLWLMTGPLDQLKTLPNNAVIFQKNELLNTAVFPSGFDVGQITKALEAHTLQPKNPTRIGTRRNFTEATGSETRLGLAPFFELDDGRIITSPSLLRLATLAIFRNIMHGRLPSGRPSRQQTPLEGALGASRRIWTEVDFEDSVRSEFRKAGFRCVEIPAGPITKRQIDGVVANVKNRRLWVISVKDLMAALRPKQQIEQIDRFYKDFLPQLDANVMDIQHHLEEIQVMLSKESGVDVFPSDISDWSIDGLFVTRELPPVVGMTSSIRVLPRIILRRQIPQFDILD